MKKLLYIFSLIASAALLLPGCDEDPYSLGYDISLPAVTVNAVSDDKPFVGDTIRIEGENMLSVATVAIDVYNFSIIEKKDNYIRVVVPRVVDGGAFTMINSYKRQFTTTQVLKPQFYPAVVDAWPTEIQRGKPFILKGQNLDLLKEVKINGKVVSIMGAASAAKVSYATAGIDLGETAVIEVTPKTGDKNRRPNYRLLRQKIPIYRNKQLCFGTLKQHPEQQQVGAEVLSQLPWSTVSSEKLTK